MQLKPLILDFVGLPFSLRNCRNNKARQNYPTEGVPAGIYQLEVKVPRVVNLKLFFYGLILLGFNNAKPHLEI